MQNNKKFVDKIYWQQNKINTPIITLQCQEAENGFIKINENDFQKLRGLFLHSIAFNEVQLEHVDAAEKEKQQLKVVAKDALLKLQQIKEEKEQLERINSKAFDKLAEMNEVILMIDQDNKNLAMELQKRDKIISVLQKKLKNISSEVINFAINK